MAGSSGDDIIYLELGDVIGLYANLFGCSDTQAQDQLRSPGGLASALMRPRNFALYQGADLALQAAVLAHGIAVGQHFVDGNKRIVLVAMRTFLLVNGYQVRATQEERARWILELSTGLSVDELSALIRAALLPVS